MKTLSLHAAKARFSRVVAEVEAGEEVVVTKHGRPVARIMPVEGIIERTPGDWRQWPGWGDYAYEASVFAAMSEDELAAEGWPV